jgi:GAF domain-containing protein
VATVTGPPRPEETLIALADILVTEQSLEKSLRQVLELACEALPGGDEGGITLLEAEGPGTAIATSAAARRVDRTQYEAATGGPCLSAYRRQEIMRIDSTATDQRWPDFARIAAGEGLGSTLSIPLVVSGDGLGALNIYCHRENGFAAADERLAAKLGSCASVALGNARIFWRAARLADQLQEALSTHGIIAQATGIMIGHRGCSADHALHLLTAAAQRNRLPLTELATDLVRRTSRGEPLA